jgi:hypothetical protein
VWAFFYVQFSKKGERTMTDNSFWNSFSSGVSDFADGVSDFFNVGSIISPSANMSGDDVLKTKSALNAVGSYDVPDFGITEIPDNNMIDGLKNFQANNGLKVDGVMKPGGPTENALGQTLANSGVSTTDLLEKVKTPSINPTPDVPKPTATPKPPQTSWSASAPLGEAPKPKKPKLPKIDPMTGLEDPLASAPKGKMPTPRQWEEVAKMQQKKASSAIIPQGDTVDQRIRSMMSDRRYGDQHDTRPRDHVVKQFERAYPGKVEYDETGKMVQPTAAITPDQVEAYDPNGELSSIMQANDDGSYTFTPESDGPGDAEFTYTVSDGAEKTPQASAYSQEDDWDQNNPERTWNPDEERKTAEENISKQVKESLGGRKLKGTTFFGGAGMEGGYIDDMVKSLEEAGLNNVRAADPKKWSRGGMGQDAVSVPMQNDRDRQPSDFSGFGEEGEQFNLVGYSYGGLQAAQAAADYADSGGVVDNLVLMGTPVEKGFLEKLQNHPNIKSVRIMNLEDQGDPIKAGMSDMEIIGSVPKLGLQWIDDKDGNARGHFYYSDEGEAGKKRRRALTSKLATWGLK